MKIYEWLKRRKRPDKPGAGSVFGLLLLLAFSAVFVSGCAKENTEHGLDGEEKLRVVTTIFPQYDFVRQTAGDKVDLKMLLKPGEESHSYEPTPKDIIDIQNCDLFIYVGGENDEWVEDILDSVDRTHLRTLRLVDCVDTVEEENVAGMKEERHEEEEGTFDEHVWTSRKNAVRIVENITEILCGEDPRNEEEFRQAAKVYEDKLLALDKEFQKTVQDSARHTVLFGDRFPFRYFADAYGLDYYAAFPGCASDTEPSAATMAYLINKVKEENIPVVLKMELSNDNIAKAIAEATGAEVKVFYSCHNITAGQFRAGETYLSMMEKNVETLKEALSDGIN